MWHSSLQAGDELFVAAEPGKLNACVGACDRSLWLLGQHYASAARALAEAALDGEATLDAVIEPIVFLRRHALELVLKDLISMGMSLTGRSEIYPKHHDLKKLWEQVAQLVQQELNSEHPPGMEHVQRIIEEFDAHDPWSLSFR